MFLEQWIHRVEGKVVALGRGLWRSTPKSDLEEQIQALTEERQTNEVASQELHQQATQLRAQVEGLKERIDHLVRKVSGFVRDNNEAAAWPLVLELDELRRQQAEVTPRLPKLEQAAWSLQFRNRQIERQLDELRVQLERRQPPPAKPRRRPRS